MTTKYSSSYINAHANYKEVAPFQPQNNTYFFFKKKINFWNLKAEMFLIIEAYQELKGDFKKFFFLKKRFHVSHMTYKEKILPSPSLSGPPPLFFFIRKNNQNSYLTLFLPLFLPQNLNLHVIVYVYQLKVITPPIKVL